MPPDSDTSPAPAATEIEAYKAVRAHEVMLNQATAAFEHAAIAPLLLINGGGAVAFLTLLGATSDKDAEFRVALGWAVGAIAAWSAGLIVAAGAATFGLLNQRAISKAHRLRRDVAEQTLLGKSPMGEALRPDDYSREEWNKNRLMEKKRADEFGKQYGGALWGSIACFVAGAICAAISVL
jgi:hypothetical protein